MGLDISQKMLTQAHSMTQGNGIVYQREDLENAYLAPNSFDLVYSSLALHYLHDIERLFVTIYQSLTPGGMLVSLLSIQFIPHRLTRAGSKIKPGNSPPINHYQQEGERISNWFAEGVKTAP